VLTALFIIPLLASIGVIGRYLYSRIFDIDPWAEIQTQPSLSEEIKDDDEVAPSPIVKQAN
jgi:hypothetical protein